jgi:hypothetical protein
MRSAALLVLACAGCSVAPPVQTWDVQPIALERGEVRNLEDARHADYYLCPYGTMILRSRATRMPHSARIECR